MRPPFIAGGTRVALSFIRNCSPAQTESRIEFRLYAGTSDAAFLRNDDLVGMGSSEVEHFTEFGFRYLRRINDQLSLETGINYATADLVFRPLYMGMYPAESWKEELELVSLPLFVNYTVWDILFFNGGPLLDFQRTENTSDSQSGIGYSLELGGQYYFGDFSIFVNPNFKRRAVISFEKENYHQKLTLPILMEKPSKSWKRKGWSNPVQKII